jgi:HEPN domain-containing protein
VTDLTKGRLIELAEAKLADAIYLQAAGRSANAYYLAGYAVELMLKAVISTRFKAETLPDRKLVDQLHSHRLADLARVAGLSEEIKLRSETDPIFKAVWETTVGWSEGARYTDRGSEAEQLIRAIADPVRGILGWIRAQL